MTPEGRVKAKINGVLKPYVDADVLYKFMPVPGGFGASSLDYLFCYRGMFIAIEAKRPGGEPTDRQDMIAQRITNAGGRVFVIDGANGQLEQLVEFLESSTHVPSSSVLEAQNAGGAVRSGR